MQNLNGTCQGCCLIFYHAEAFKCNLRVIGILLGVRVIEWLNDVCFLGNKTHYAALKMV
jgi:hypothetical protein